MWPPPPSSHKPHVCGNVPRSLGQAALPPTMLPEAASGVLNCPTARRACSIVGRALVSCPVETGLRDCCRLAGSAWPRHPSPASSQGSQLLGTAAHPPSKHTELQTGLKGKQNTTAIRPHSFYWGSLLASSALIFQPSWAGQGSWDWATGKEPGLIRVTSPPEVAE